MNIKRTLAILTTALVLSMMMLPSVAHASGILDTVKDKAGEAADYVRENGPGWLESAKEGAEAVKDGVITARDEFAEWNDQQPDIFWDWFERQTGVTSVPAVESVTPPNANIVDYPEPYQLESGYYTIQDVLCYYDATKNDWSLVSFDPQANTISLIPFSPTQTPPIDITQEDLGNPENSDHGYYAESTQNDAPETEENEEEKLPDGVTAYTAYTKEFLGHAFATDENGNYTADSIAQIAIFFLMIIACAFAVIVWVVSLFKG